MQHIIATLHALAVVATLAAIAHINPTVGILSALVAAFVVVRREFAPRSRSKNPPRLPPE